MYIISEVPIWRMLETQLVIRAFSRAWAKTGKRIAARMAIMAITTSSSIRVNPACRRFMECLHSRTTGASGDDEAKEGPTAILVLLAFPGADADSCVLQARCGGFTNI